MSPHREHRPHQLDPSEKGDGAETYGLGLVNRDAAFCVAMIRAGHKPTGIKQPDPKDARVVARPVGATHVMTSSPIERLS